MGHKVHPNGFRLGVIKGWESRWYANRTYKDLLGEDLKIRALINKRLANAAVARIEIERVAGTQISVAIHTAKPGIVIGKSGESVERLRQALEDLTKKKVRLSILEIRNPEVDATLIARSIAEQLEKRVSFRRAMKQAVQKAMRAGAKGIKVIVGGRLGGAEIARSEKEVEGSVPLQTLRANIDYALAEARTTYGAIGIKVWVYHGQVLPERQRAEGMHATQGEPAIPAGGGRAERGSRPERGERGPRRGPGGPGGERGERGPRRSPGGVGGERSPRPPRPSGGTSTSGATTAGGVSERSPRPSRSTHAAGGAGPRSQTRSEAAPQAQPSGELTHGEGADLSTSGSVTPPPAARDLPAPTSNAEQTAPEQIAQAETKPETSEE